MLKCRAFICLLDFLTSILLATLHNCLPCLGVVGVGVPAMDAFMVMTSACPVTGLKLSKNLQGAKLLARLWKLHLNLRFLQTEENRASG